jgi:hypothetical protein
MSKVYRIEREEDFKKFYDWLQKGDFDDLSLKCVKPWYDKYLKKLLSQKDYSKEEFNIFLLEDDKGEIKMAFSFEVRFPEKDKIPVKTAVYAFTIFKKGSGKNEYNELIKYVCKWGYERGIFLADVWCADTLSEWNKELFGEFTKVIAEAEFPNVGHYIRHLIDVKGFVEWLSSQ